MTTIDGYCPMGCGTTLFIAEGGCITCSYLHCPRPTAVDELLADRETEHIVTFNETTFIVRHPLRERLDDALVTCELHAHIASLDGPPVKPGAYRGRHNGTRWMWQEI